MKNITRIINFIQTKEFAFLALAFSLIPQILHSYTSFYSLARGMDLMSEQIVLVIGAIFFALGLSAAILILTLLGWTRIAIGALAIEFFINLVYYKIWVDDLLILHILRSIYGLIMPLTIALYSHVMEFFLTKEKEVNVEVKMTLKEVEDNNQKMLQDVINLIPKNDNIKEIVESYIESTNFVLSSESGKQLKVKIKEDAPINTEED